MKATGKVLFYPLSPHVELRKSSTTCSKFEDEVDAIWARQAPLRGLYNGTLLAVDSFTENEIIAFPVEYKYFVASNLDPVLKRKLNIKALGINALTLCREDILVGRRSSNAHLYANLIETPPCGSFDAFDIQAHIAREFEEETGLEASCMVSCTIVGLFYCTTTGIYDIGVKIEVSSEGRMMPLHCSAEHSLLEWWPLERFMKLKRDEVVPTSWELVSRFVKNKKALE